MNKSVNKSVNKKIALFLSIVLSVLTSSGGILADQPKKPYHVPLTTLPVKIDGVIAEEAWKNALMLELKYEVDPGENVPAPVKTEFFITYSKSHLYAAFRCYDPNPSQIRAHLSDRDNDYGDDFVGIALDTFNDERKNFILWSNPHGVQEDAVMIRNIEYDISWDARYKSVGKIFDWGYSVEMAVPFSSLRFQRGNGSQVWGIDAWRNYPRSVRHQLGLFPRDRNNNCYQCQMIKVKGFEGIKPGRNLEVTPTLTAVRTDARDKLPDGKLEKRNQDADFGVTTRWGITPNLTFSGTYNPDFSQVEADAAQLDINEPFSLYYQEKRPFFTEGADVFKTNLNTVYTRTLRDPVWGVKLSGKEGRNSIGAYIVRDDITNLIFPGSQGSYTTSLDMPSTASVFRYKRDFGNKYTVGALFTNRQGEDYYNRVFGFDGVFRLTPRDLLEVEILGSSTRYPDETAAGFLQKSGNFNDKAIFVSFRHSTRNLNVFGGYKDLGPDFRADLGFIPQVGYHQFHSAADYRWLAKPGKWWNMFLVGGMFYKAKEHQGNLLYEGLETVFIFNGALQSEFLLVTNIEREGYNGAIFDQIYSRGKLRLRPTADLDITVETKVGDRIDYSNSRPGKRFLLTSEIKYSLGNHLRLSVGHMYERMRADKKKLYTANISQGTLIYQFNTRMFFRSILQYVNYSYNPENYLFPVNPEYKNLFVQLLFSYKLSPQTVLFLGYSDNHVGTYFFPLTRSDHTLFLKIGYAWQL